ncbi:hypothetical protein R1sor_016123 [Riccia sorocarpa]|uniref:Uncharacterized protein n=1 Tax=Riccia sorocarpa TaxID=122646 RepID=A0ABD3HI51_9MARC
MPHYCVEPCFFEVCTLWGGDGVETVHPCKNLEDGAKMKSFRRLYDHGICLRDVLLVDTLPERNSLNDPYSGVHPKAVEKFPSVPESSTWLLSFTDWLAMWSESLLATVEFVRSFRHVMDGFTDPLLVLRDFWEETPQPVDHGIIWGEVPSGRRVYLTAEWPDFYFHRESPAEEAPAEGAAPVEETVHVEEAPTEGAAPVEEAIRVEEASAEGAAPVEEATRVEEAPAERAAPVEEATRVEEAPAVGAAPVEEATRVEEAPAVGAAPE